ncbi:hypothetical protein A2U01_0031202, partial [Trifolium medium]|nr:hypothetical protein [Trifolium medium]
MGTPFEEEYQYR